MAIFNKSRKGLIRSIVIKLDYEIVHPFYLVFVNFCSHKYTALFLTAKLKDYEAYKKAQNGGKEPPRRRYRKLMD